MSMQNDILLKCLRKETIERPPIWIMRQAGRILPEYRELRSNFPNFKAFIKTPKAVREATIQPLDRLDVDACILFSDILVIPEAMGCDYDLVEKVGPVFRNTISNEDDVTKLLQGAQAADKINYVYEAISETLEGIEDRVPLIGFSGAPWTLFAYMVEGKGSKTFSEARKFLYQKPDLAKLALDKITDTTIAYLKRKIASGVHAVQLFDSWLGVLDIDLFNEFCKPLLERIRREVTEAPLIYFPKDGWFAMDSINDIGFDAIGIDWSVAPSYARSVFGPDQILQGNLDPCALYGSPLSIANKANATMDAFGRNHIFNLGHGVYPDMDKDHVKHLVDTIKCYRYS